MESHAIAQSLDTARYRSYIVDPNSQPHSHRGKKLVKKENDLDQLSSGAIGRNLVQKYDDIIIKGDYSDKTETRIG